ncbi:MAG TPA: DNA mismatch repair endonuclease MutL [Anaerolineales bacterium]|nr:DNA mismatch repair endonuclease MutL [Anaerolineales bacterium]
MPIRVLPESVASAIAAGEVVERPASVVKELVENALDAGAQRIEIRLRSAGEDLIEVGDDGAGIAADELALATSRYATSKLQTIEDLYALRSLGFRGEALASIAAVSRLEIVSRPEGAAAGARLTVEGGTLSAPTAVGAPHGTLVRVRDLFYNTPARRKFLKSESAERRRIHDMIGRYAFAYPGVSFHLTQDDRLVLQSSGDGDRRQALAASLGLNTAREMLLLPEPAADVEVRVEGLIGPPSVHRANRRELTFFVNGHLIQDAGLAAAVVQAYHGLLMVGRYPMVFLWIEVAPDEVDVNVHPGKAEVRFRRPDLVYGRVQRSLRTTLLNQAGAPEMDLPRAWSSAGPDMRTPFAPRASDDEMETAASVHLTLSMFPPPARPSGALPLLRAVGQVGSSYLVAEGPDGLYLIDQHAAHERVLFEAMMRAQAEHHLEVQTLLDPQPVELQPEEIGRLEELLPTLESLGVAVEPFGGATVRVRSLPALASHLRPSDVLRTVLGQAEDDETPLAAEVEARLAARVCKRAAVKAGQILSLAEQDRLVRDLEACRSPRTCPHGRPTMIHISVDALERQFGRRG